MSAHPDTIGDELSDWFDEDVAVSLDQLADQGPRTLCQGSLVTGEQVHIYIDYPDPKLVLAIHRDATLIRIGEEGPIYATQIGQIRSLNPSALDPEFSEHLVRIGYSPDLMTPGQYERRLHEPVLSSLSLP